MYVHALSDAPVMTWEEADGRRIESVKLEGLYAICERRDDAPPLTERELQRQHSIVVRIAAAVPAVLPARFGSLVDEAELAAILRQRADALRTALELVRDNVQMTLRLAVPSAMKGGDRQPVSGREYLRRRREALFPPLPSQVEAALRSLRAYVLKERRKSEENGIVTVYHLVRRRDANEYRETIARERVPGIAVSGPWPPFAFTPELLA